MNKYNLGVPLTQEQNDAFWERQAEGEPLGRHAEEYWSVIDKALTAEQAKAMIRIAYNLPESGEEFIHFRRGAFITIDTDLAQEMIRVLRMDFVHDFKTGLFIFDNFGNHEMTMGSIYEAVVGDLYYGTLEENAEDYVNRGYGCFQSSVRPNIMIGKDSAIPSYLTQFRGKFERL